MNRSELFSLIKELNNTMTELAVNSKDFENLTTDEKEEIKQMLNSYSKLSYAYDNMYNAIFSQLLSFGFASLGLTTIKNESRILQEAPWIERRFVITDAFGETKTITSIHDAVGYFCDLNKQYTNEYKNTTVYEMPIDGVIPC